MEGTGQDSFTVTMQVKVVVKGGQADVYTDGGDHMGTYESFDELGRALGDEFKYRLGMPLVYDETPEG